MEHVETVIIGAGQAGLATAYHLQRRGRECVVLDRSHRVGDGWRQQWDSLRLYSPAKLDGLPGMPFPGEPWSFPGKDQVGDYLESYAARFELPVRLGVRVDRLSAAPDGEGYVVASDAGPIRCDNVVVATGTFGRTPNIPAADHRSSRKFTAATTSACRGAMAKKHAAKSATSRRRVSTSASRAASAHTTAYRQSESKW